ncbi:DUF2135 domain-containing protein [Candidatus Uabimicrobium amorphum]|uniref:VIT domain-containing protein n=1 Tax=Uabimicrobium amorphum TaxID=2596890 RepID=A0A5S9F869_UABAM|nr:DUF2135 domain-containing protein [Candidatus Uabimicrobium amorphum]BBM87972.1 hypothetical protein UABAM_06388 [Candidatus Uabimicrobium amorphum]
MPLRILVVIICSFMMSCSTEKSADLQLTNSKRIVDAQPLGLRLFDNGEEEDSLVEGDGDSIELESDGKITEKDKETGQKQDAKKWVRNKKDTNVAQVRVGNDEFLELKSVRTLVSVEGIRTRTVVDHVFHNSYERTLEGDFRYKLPDNASICYFAFYPEGFVSKDSDKEVALPSLPTAAQIHRKKIEDYFAEEESNFGKAKIAHAVPRQKALQAYEAVVRRGVDPALVEWAGGNVFITRVFPLQANQYYRIVIGYEQTLIDVEDVITYQFSCADVDSDFMLVADKSYIESSQMNVATPASESDEFVSYQTRVRNKNVVFRANLTQKFITSQDEKQGITYSYGYVSPQFSSPQYNSRSKRAIFLLDTSLSQEKQEFGMYVALLEKILERNRDIEEFNVLFFDVSSGWLQDGWIANSPVGLALFRDKTQVMHLEGATDVTQALQHMVDTPWLNEQNANVDVFFLSNGQHNWGELSLRKSMAKFRQKLQFSPHFFCYNLGLGTANTVLFDLLNEFGGGSFSSTMQLDELAVAHRRSTLFVENIYGEGISDLVTAGSVKVLYPGQRILLAGKITGNEARITITGRIGTQRKSFVFTVPTKSSGSLAPRAFGELVVRKMESLEDPALEETIVAYARYFSIPGKTCSLLMLESQEDYQEFNVNLQKDSQKIENTMVKQVLENIDASLEKSISSPKNSFMYFWETLKDNELVKLNPQNVEELLSLLDDTHFTFSPQKLRYDFSSQKEGASENFLFYIKKAQSYDAKRNLSGYLRAVSSIVELKSQESSALRVAGYLLLKEQVASHAVSIFTRVRDKRPFEPQVYRDLAKSYAALEKYHIAALYYEILISGTWNERFRQINSIAQEEYAHILRKITQETRESFFQKRLQSIAEKTTQHNDITVTITWTTNDTDVDLWVIEPSGEKCYYENKNTRSGGQISDDVTQGYGPERYALKKAAAGEYKIKVNYFRSNEARISDITFVETTITTHSGSRDARTRSFYTMLTSSKEETHIDTLKW